MITIFVRDSSVLHGPGTTSYSWAMTEAIPQTVLDAALVAKDAVNNLAKQANVANDPFFDLESPLALPEESIVVNHFRRLLGNAITDAPQCNYPEITGDITLLRCLRGRMFDIPVCLDCFRTHIELRIKLGLNDMRDRIVTTHQRKKEASTSTSTPEEEDPHHYTMTDLIHGTIAKKYMYCIPNCGFTPQGHVIIFTPTGQHDTRGLLTELTADQYFEYIMEELVRRQLQLEYLSQKHQRLIKMFQIVDCSGVGLSHVSHTAMLTFTKRIKVVLQTWPEGMARVSVINTPWVVTNFWNGFLKFLFPVRSRRKFKMYGSQYRKEILHLIDPTTLAKLLATNTSGGGDGGGGNTLCGTLELSAGSDKELILSISENMIGLQISIKAIKSDVSFSMKLFASMTTEAVTSRTNETKETNEGEVGEESGGGQRRKRSSMGFSTSGSEVIPATMVTETSGTTYTKEMTMEDIVGKKSGRGAGLLVLNFSNKHSWMWGTAFNYNIVPLYREDATSLNVEEVEVHL